MTPGPIGVAIIDDDPGFVEAVAELVALEPGLTVIGTAGSVAHGLELLTDIRVRLALVDVHMPDGGGLRLVDEVRRWPNAPELTLISAQPPDAETLRDIVQRGGVVALGTERLKRGVQDLGPATATLGLNPGGAGGARGTGHGDLGNIGTTTGPDDI